MQASLESMLEYFVACCSTNVMQQIAGTHLPGSGPMKLVVYVQVQIKDGKLTISGKRERSSQPEEAKKRRFSERHFGRFSRQLRLPQDADSKNIKAKVDNGVLTVRVSKLAQLPGVEDVRIDF